MATLAASCVQVILRLAATVINPSSHLLALIAELRDKIQDESRLSICELADLFATMSQDAGDEDVGVRAYGLFHPGQLNAQLYPIMSSSTLGEGLTVVEKFSSLLAESAPVSIGYSQDCFYIRFHRFEALGVSRQYIDCCMSTMMGLIHWLLPVDKPVPVATTFSYSMPDNVEGLTSVFGPTLRFSAGCNQIAFDFHEWSRPLVTANSALKAYHLQHSNEELLRRRSARAADEVKTHIMETLGVGKMVTLDAIARRLNTSSRTLQNRLDEELTTYRALLDQSRLELANRLLLHTDGTVSSIAAHLAFRDSSSFHKACQRWFGCSPGTYRARALKLERSAGG